MQKQKLHYALCANLKDSITHRVYKLQFIGLIGGRVFNPRQQQVAYSRLVTISRCSSLLLPRVTNPPPN